jgi:O-antigen/teichoic acid export membrane protein
LFGGVLEGLQRFTWLGIVQTGATLVRAGLIVWALQQGAGILAVGVITVAVNLISSLLYVGVVFRLCPGLHLRPSLARVSTLRTLAGFGLVTFWISIAQVLRFQFDSLVIAAFLSLQAVTLFSVSSKLVSYVTEVVQAMAQIFTPMSSALDATGDRNGLRRVLLVSNRYSAFLILPMAAVLLFTGASILRVWVGPSYTVSYSVLVTLTIPTALYLAQAGSPKVLYGMAEHRMLAVVLGAEGVANLVLSSLLAPRFGIDGVAVGTAVPLAATSLFFLPGHLCKLLDIRLRDFLFESYFYPVLCSLPLCLTLWGLNRWVQPDTWATLLATLAAGGVVYGIAFLLYFYFVEPGTRRVTGRGRVSESHWRTKPTDADY